MLQGIHQHISESCILLWQDFKFSKEACVARHMVTKQLFTPDREKLSKGLKKTFPGMSTLSNYIIKSIPLKWSPCEFVPLINWKIVDCVYPCLHNGKLQYFYFNSCYSYHKYNTTHYCISLQFEFKSTRDTTLHSISQVAGPAQRPGIHEVHGAAIPCPGESALATSWT